MRFLECVKSALVNDEEVISLSHAKGLCILRFCVMSWKILLGNSSWVGSKIHHNTELWTRLTENRWNSSEIFSQEQKFIPRSPKVHEQNGRPSAIPRTNYLHVDVQ